MEEAYECMTSNQLRVSVRMRESRSDSDDAACSTDLQPPAAKRCRLQHSSFPSRFLNGVADRPPQRERRRRGTQTYGGHHAAAVAASSVDEAPACSGHEGVVVVVSEELFRKELTPSDVGKLNRLVIPKKHAQRHFPRIQAPAACGGGGGGSVEGMMLEFEDVAGRPWEFRYCYWRSSQSFVFTKGWSRFIRTKRLREGDVVAFYRCECKYGRRKPFCMIDVVHAAGAGGRRDGEHVRTCRDYWKEEGGEFVSEPDQRVWAGKKSFMLFGVQITSA